MLPQAKSSRPRTTIGSFAFVGSAIDSVDRRVDAISTDQAVERSEQLLSAREDG
jgi:Uri superfamily endonuclease